MKACNKCGQTKPLTAFVKDRSLKSGFGAICRECRVSQQKEYNRSYEARETKKRWISETGKGQRYKAEKERRQKSLREKERARSKARYHRNKGNLKPSPCEGCGSEENIHMHHDDYSKPLDVRWLCGRCHAAIHPGVEVSNA